MIVLAAIVLDAIVLDAIVLDAIVLDAPYYCAMHDVTSQQYCSFYVAADECRELRSKILRSAAVPGKSNDSSSQTLRALRSRNHGYFQKSLLL